MATPLPAEALDAEDAAAAPKVSMRDLLQRLAGQARSS